MVQRKFTTLGISANTDMFVRQMGEPGQVLVPIPPLKQTKNELINRKLRSRKHLNILITGKTKTVQWHIAVVELYIDLQSKASLQERKSLGTIHI